VDILLVDDNPLMQQLIVRFLSDLGYKVAAAGRADEAIELARRAVPALLLIDMHLPDRDGPEALLDIRALPGCEKTPAIAMSGLDESEARRIMTKDFAAYLPKPVDLDVLQATVMHHLGDHMTRSVGYGFSEKESGNGGVN
jgi:two-component system cell cycle response regulator DivK